MENVNIVLIFDGHRCHEKNGNQSMGWHVAGGITNIIFLPLFFGKKGNTEKKYIQSHGNVVKVKRFGHSHPAFLWSTHHCL